MSKRPAPVLPDIGDDEIKARLQPLIEEVVPKRTPGKATRSKVVNAEFLMPEPVRMEMRIRAAKRGISASKLLLEILRDAGYPVSDADFVDLRKLPRKAG
jgi:hypothetical protein